MLRIRLIARPGMLFLTALTLALVVTVKAASPVPSGSPSPSPTPVCQEPQFRQFDFWLGNWKVIGAKGNQVGTSEISRVSEGCAVREQWRAADGKGGTSLNYYDASDHEWHQDWVGGDGTILHLHGGRQGESMILANRMPTKTGSYSNRITYTPLPGGKVKQVWAYSLDHGATWKISFLGTYEKKPE